MSWCWGQDLPVQVHAIRVGICLYKQASAQPRQPKSIRGNTAAMPPILCCMYLTIFRGLQILGATWFAQVPYVY